MNKLQKTLTVALTALALTVTSQAPSASAADVNNNDNADYTIINGMRIPKHVKLVIKYLDMNGNEIAPRGEVKVPRPEGAGNQSDYRSYLPELKKEINYNGKVYQYQRENGVAIQASPYPLEAYMNYYYAEKKPVVKSEKPLRVPAGNNGAKTRVPVAKKQQPKQEVKKYRLPAGNNGVKTRKPVAKKQQPQQPQQPEVIQDVDYL